MSNLPLGGEISPFLIEVSRSMFDDPSPADERGNAVVGLPQVAPQPGQTGTGVREGPYNPETGRLWSEEEQPSSPAGAPGGAENHLTLGGVVPWAQAQSGDPWSMEQVAAGELWPDYPGYGNGSDPGYNAYSNTGGLPSGDHPTQVSGQVARGDNTPTRVVPGPARAAAPHPDYNLPTLSDGSMTDSSTQWPGESKSGRKKGGPKRPQGTRPGGRPTSRVGGPNGSRNPLSIGDELTLPGRPGKKGGRLQDTASKGPHIWENYKWGPNDEDVPIVPWESPQPEKRHPLVRAAHALGAPLSAAIVHSGHQIDSAQQMYFPVPEVASQELTINGVTERLTPITRTKDTACVTSLRDLLLDIRDLEELRGKRDKGEINFSEDENNRFRQEYERRDYLARIIVSHHVAQFFGYPGAEELDVKMPEQLRHFVYSIIDNYVPPIRNGTRKNPLRVEMRGRFEQAYREFVASLDPREQERYVLGLGNKSKTRISFDDYYRTHIAGRMQYVGGLREVNLHYQVGEPIYPSPNELGRVERRIEDILTTTKPTSEVSSLNVSRPRGFSPITDEDIEAVEQAVNSRGDSSRQIIAHDIAIPYNFLHDHADGFEIIAQRVTASNSASLAMNFLNNTFDAIESGNIISPLAGEIRSESQGIVVVSRKGDSPNKPRAILLPSNLCQEAIINLLKSHLPANVYIIPNTGDFSYERGLNEFITLSQSSLTQEGYSSAQAVSDPNIGTEILIPEGDGELKVRHRPVDRALPIVMPGMVGFADVDPWKLEEYMRQLNKGATRLVTAEEALHEMESMKLEKGQTIASARVIKSNTGKSYLIVEQGGVPEYSVYVRSKDGNMRSITKPAVVEYMVREGGWTQSKGDEVAFSMGRAFTRATIQEEYLRIACERIGEELRESKVDSRRQKNLSKLLSLVRQETSRTPDTQPRLDMLSPKLEERLRMYIPPDLLELNKQVKAEALPSVPEVNVRDAKVCEVRDGDMVIVISRRVPAVVVAALAQMYTNPKDFKDAIDRLNSFYSARRIYKETTGRIDAQGPAFDQALEQISSGYSQERDEHRTQLKVAVLGMLHERMVGRDVASDQLVRQPVMTDRTREWIGRGSPISYYANAAVMVVGESVMGDEVTLNGFDDEATLQESLGSPAAPALRAVPATLPLVHTYPTEPLPSPELEAAPEATSIIPELTEDYLARVEGLASLEREEQTDIEIPNPNGDGSNITMPAYIAHVIVQAVGERRNIDIGDLRNEINRGTRDYIDRQLRNSIANSDILNRIQDSLRDLLNAYIKFPRYYGNERFENELERILGEEWREVLRERIDPILINYALARHYLDNLEKRRQASPAVTQELPQVEEE